MSGGKAQLVVASNRLPVELERDDGLTVQPSPGGLAPALTSLLDRAEGTWVGWAGLPGPVDLPQVLDEAGTAFPFSLEAIELSKTEIDRYYRGFSNQILWPLFHGMHALCEFEPKYWDAYREVNDRFAARVAEATGPGDRVWIHDYQLVPTGRILRDLGIDTPVGFFLHIPFPSPDLLHRLPWYEELLDALFAYDLLGFQTRDHLLNFEHCIDKLQSGEFAVEVGPHTAPAGSEDEQGPGPQRASAGPLEDVRRIRAGDRVVHAGVFPISIDDESIRKQASAPAVENRCSEVRKGTRGSSDIWIVGVERLDYTKGILQRLRAFQRCLELFPELRGKITLVQHLNPSREEIGSYQNLRTDIERAVGRINGRFGTLDWVPIRYSFGHLAFQDVLTVYRLGDIALVTPLRDGMNLVAKEYCACKLDDDGVLVLSEFAGATEELGEHALVVNPHDVDHVAETIHRACTMDPDERRKRMSALREHIRTHDVHAWARGYLEVLDGISQARGTHPGSARGASGG